MGSLHVIQSLSHILNDDRVSFPALHQQEFQFPVSHFRQSRMHKPTNVSQAHPASKFPGCRGLFALVIGDIFHEPNLLRLFFSVIFAGDLYLPTASKFARFQPHTPTARCCDVAAFPHGSTKCVRWVHFFGRDWSFCRVREIRAIHRQQHTRFRNPAMVHYGPDW